MFSHVQKQNILYTIITRTIIMEFKWQQRGLLVRVTGFLGL